jgi:hypothetical protein
MRSVEIMVCSWPLLVQRLEARCSDRRAQWLRLPAPLSKRQQGVYRWELEVCISWPDFHGAAMTIMYGGPEWVLYRGKSRKSLNKVIKTVRDHPRLMLITIKDPKGQIERVPPQRIVGRS